MTAIRKAGEHCSTADVRRALSALMPHLTSYWERPLRDYASVAHDVKNFHSESSARRHAMELLCRCVKRAARRSGYDHDEAQSASLQLMASPVLQTGPHCLLLIEPDAFYTHLFSLLGLNANSREWYITYHASTVSFAEKAKKGPGWLWLEGEPLNVFGLPRGQMDSFSICGSNGPYRFAFSNAKGDPAPNDSAAYLLSELPSDEFSSAADAIRAANQTLWRGNLPSPIKLLQLDDFDIADLVADHFDDAGSWMSARFIGGGKVAESILDAMDRLNIGSWQGWVRRTTDLFWRLEKGRIVPLRLQGNTLRARTPSSFAVSFRPDRIAAALRQRAIVPSLYTVFLVLSILPGVRALGGCRQTIYYPLMRYLTAIGLERSGNFDLLSDLRGDDRPGLWGHRVLKPADGYPFQDIGFFGEAPRPLSEYAEMPLVKSSGDLARFTGDPIWANLSEQIANGVITSGSTEWQLSGS
ncbi:hypothetical protein GOC91_27455 [Sinorhizobium medicae]|uniref:Uncharacterized protein n=1 Tax=Sinorhizobium medicae (strain WSM419) TaxID=366394 RepID=A6ULF5_SINMW|nr:hypothetical protein [Sinorhizobium medicae]ABR64485.1 hypothetical protein Smed_5779 [Sinorhizobium medicae WSM419]MDX0408123.1 hypothetical protein [Sinorhizobium medicae]MDX0414472.1 hypothetical protein [Sinorhizobium medicae]MDX0420053.1 hypothetical protein [Sinorhizobium medicae]MDX0436380.1 hypothetical protein [Sinorhizobium medicae]